MKPIQEPIPYTINKTTKPEQIKPQTPHFCESLPPDEFQHHWCITSIQETQSPVQYLTLTTQMWNKCLWSFYRLHNINCLHAVKASVSEVRDFKRSNEGKRPTDHSHFLIPLLYFQNQLHFLQDRCQYILHNCLKIIFVLHRNRKQYICDQEYYFKWSIPKYEVYSWKSRIPSHFK